MIQQLSLLIPTLILVIATISDLRTKKVKNKLVLFLGVLAFATAIGFDGWQSLPWSTLSLTTAFLMGFPLFIMGVMGAGDIKVFMAFSVLLSWEAVVFVGVSSLFWGAAIGIVKSVISGEGKILVMNTWGMLRYQKKPVQSELHFLPFTVALLFGWISYIVQTQSHLWGGL